jgi:hypothetical protein
MDVVSVSVLWLVIGGVFVVTLFSVTLGAVSYGVSRSNQEFYSKREDADRLKIATLEAKVMQLEGQVATLMKLLGHDNPKGDAVAP